MTEHIYCQDNEIHLLGSLKKTNYEVLHNLFYFAQKSRKSTIDLHISSPGGELSLLDNLILLIKLSEKPVYAYIHNTKVYGIYSGVASAASVLTTYCDKIIIDKNTTFMIHHARIYFENGAIAELYDDEEDIFFWMEKTSQSYDIIESLIKQENILDAESAKNLGFINVINNDVDMYRIPSSKKINNSSLDQYLTYTTPFVF